MLPRKTTRLGLCLLTGLGAALAGYANEGNGVVTIVPTVTSGPLLGAPEFMPTPERSVGWRGDGSGIYPGARPPLEWAEGTGMNMRWRVQLPLYSNGSGASQPIVIKNRIYLTVNPKEHTQAPDDVYGLDAATGKILWIRALTSFDAASAEDRTQVKNTVEPWLQELGKLNAELIETLNAGKLNQIIWRDNVNGKRVAVAAKINDALLALNPELYKNGPRHDWGYGSATPTSDGSHVFVYFSNRLAACLDLDGKPVWATLYPQKLGATSEHGSHASPLLLPDRLVVPYGESLFALDKATGHALWEQKPQYAWGLCSSSLAAAKLRDGYAIVMAHGQAFRADNGHVLWGKMENYQGENTTPVIGDSTLVTYERSGIRTFRLPESLDGKLTPTAAVIRKDTSKEYQIASPLYHAGLVYALSSKGLLHVFDPAADGGKGAMVYDQQLEVTVADPGLAPSPAIAGDRLYVLDNSGALLVFQAGRTYKELACNRLAVKDLFVVSPVFFDKSVLLRGQSWLYCVGEQ